ncbi:MAG: hypothetical protein AB1665_04620 [Candidatus Thermoplasmatota archaeon]
MSTEDRRYKHTDAEEVREILDVVAEKVPQLLNEITDALFSAEKAEQFGESVAKFYKSMIGSGMSQEQAFQLTEKFMESANPGGLIAKAIRHDSEDDAVELEIKKKIKEKLAGKFEDE